MAAGGEVLIEHKSKADVFNLWCLGDLHYGSKACALNMLRRDLKAIAEDPQARWLGMGDYAEFIGITDNRFDPDAVAENIRVKDLKTLGKSLMAMVYELLGPIGDKCIGILAGNHEKKYEAHKEQGELTQELAEKLHTAYHGYWTYKYLVFRHKPRKVAGTTNRFLIFAHHGSGYASTSGGKLNKLVIAWTIMPEADMTLLAHVHEPLVHPNIYLTPNQNASKTLQHRNIAVTTGCYFKTYADEYDTYGAQKLYRPVDLGAKVLHITPYHKNDIEYRPIKVTI